jgi:hypothetical protein
MRTQRTLQIVGCRHGDITDLHDDVADGSPYSNTNPRGIVTT